MRGARTRTWTLTRTASLLGLCLVAGCGDDGVTGDAGPPDAVVEDGASGDADGAREDGGAEGDHFSKIQG